MRRVRREVGAIDGTGLVCHVGGECPPVMMGFIAYAVCHHVVCEAHMSAREWRTRPEPLACVPCRKSRRYRAIAGG